MHQGCSKHPRYVWVINCIKNRDKMTHLPPWSHHLPMSWSNPVRFSSIFPWIFPWIFHFHPFSHGCYDCPMTFPARCCCFRAATHLLEQCKAQGPVAALGAGRNACVRRKNMGKPMAKMTNNGFS